MHQTCRQCSIGFEITDEDLAFLDKVSPIFNDKKEPIPSPTLCSDCRLQRRLVRRNQIQVYRGTSSVTGKQIMSMFPEDLTVVQMEPEEWYKDAHDPLAHGKDWDPSQPLFSQLAPLLQVVPLYSLSVLSVEASEFSNNASFMKNCYLTFNTSHVQDSLYCENIWHSKDCIDCSNVYGCELCYDCTSCMECYNVQNSELSNNCSDSMFLRSCKGCRNCFGCANLMNQEYCLFNEKLKKEEYERRIQELDLSSHRQRNEIAARVLELWKQWPRPHEIAVQAENSSGNFLIQTQNAYKTFFARDAQNVRYGFNTIDKVRDCMDFTIYGDDAQMLYECHIVGDVAYHLAFCNECWGRVAEMYYCEFCVACSNCFACVGLHNKQYCILNKQYTKEQYEELVPQIIEKMRESGEWGEFFPMQSTTYPYNHTIAQRYFPLTKEQALAEGLRWYDRDTEDVTLAINADQLTDGIPETDDAIIVKSAESGRAFKITSQEIKRYRQFNVPLPRIAYNERMEARAKKLFSIHLYDRTCAKTGKPIQTTIPPDSPWIVWDREVWEQEFRS
jgi:hypothetical protein